MHQHFIFHKPFNCLSQFIYEGKRKSSKNLLGKYFDFPKGTMAIGRLDENSEGLLFLTTCGKTSESIRSSKFEKEYYVQVKGVISKQEVDLLKNGVEIGFDGKKYITKPCKVKLIAKPTHLPIENRIVRNENHGSTSWVSIVLTEGKFRQVRKMVAAVGFPCLRLIRYRIGNTILDIHVKEVQQVKSLCL